VNLLMFAFLLFIVPASMAERNYAEPSSQSSDKHHQDCDPEAAGASVSLSGGDPCLVSHIPREASTRSVPPPNISDRSTLENA